MKNINVLELILSLEHIVSANDTIVKNCQILHYNRTSKETYVETRVRLCNKQKNK